MAPSTPGSIHSAVLQWGRAFEGADISSVTNSLAFT
jgi:hypothetical protein